MLTYPSLVWPNKLIGGLSCLHLIIMWYLVLYFHVEDTCCESVQTEWLWLDSGMHFACSIETQDPNQNAIIKNVPARRFWLKFQSESKSSGQHERALLLPNYLCALSMRKFYAWILVLQLGSFIVHANYSKRVWIIMTRCTNRRKYTIEMPHIINVTDVQTISYWNKEILIAICQLI